MRFRSKRGGAKYRTLRVGSVFRACQFPEGRCLLELILFVVTRSLMVAAESGVGGVAKCWGVDVWRLGWDNAGVCPL